jgi:hypothetical protein
MSDPTYTAEQWGEWMRQLTLAIQNGHGLVVCDYQPPDVPYSIQIDGPPVWKASDASIIARDLLLADKDVNGNLKPVLACPGPQLLNDLLIALVQAACIAGTAGALAPVFIPAVAKNLASVISALKSAGLTLDEIRKLVGAPSVAEMTAQDALELLIQRFFAWLRTRLGASS